LICALEILLTVLLEYHDLSAAFSYKCQVQVFFLISFYTKLGWSGPSDNFSNRYGLDLNSEPGPPIAGIGISS